MEAGHDPYGLEGRRRAVHLYFERYRKLMAAGRMEEAVENLRTASRLANESVEHTLEIARTILVRIERLCAAEREAGEGPADHTTG